VVRDGANTSDSLSRVSIEAELLFRALILAVDDYGRLDGRLPIVKSRCFPLRESFTEQRIDELLDELTRCDPPPEPGGERSGPVERYEAEGLPFLRLVNWERHRGKSRRAKESRYPAPPPRVDLSVRDEIDRSLRVVRDRRAEPRSRGA
jgi:hypothetical protein